MNYTYANFRIEFDTIKKEFDTDDLTAEQWVKILYQIVVPRLSTECLTYMLTAESMIYSNWGPGTIAAVSQELFERTIFTEST